MKALTTLLVAVLLVVSMTGCGQKSQSEKMHEKLQAFNQSVDKFDKATKKWGDAVQAYKCAVKPAATC